jgi:cytoskeletal protein CcmA (bactofilin family)
MGSVITVNGNRIEIEGDARGVVISGGTITVGGKVVASGLEGIVRVIWEGPLANLTASNNVEVHGDVHGDLKADNNVSCGNVGGSIKAGNNVSCGDVGGGVRAGNNIVRR